LSSLFPGEEIKFFSNSATNKFGPTIFLVQKGLDSS
jgi:hypothetical protein